MKKLLTITAILAATIISPEAFAGHDTPLVAAACRYRDAVVDFERHVIRSRSINRYDVRLVDDLEDSTSILRSAARDPFRGDRFNCAWDDTSILHRRVEAALFGRSCSTRLDPTLVRCWEAVTCAMDDLTREVACVLNPGYGRHPGHRHFDSTPIVPRPRVPYVPSVPTPVPPTIIPEVPFTPPAAVVPPRTSVYLDRTLSRPRYDLNGSTHIDRYRGYAPTSHHDLRAAMIGAFLTRMLNK